MILPKVLVIDDLFGRGVRGSLNDDRVNLCLAFSLDDQTGDVPTPWAPKGTGPQATAIFARGQSPAAAELGDMVGERS